MATYTPDPLNENEPITNVTPASSMADEFRAMKGHIKFNVMPIVTGAATLASPTFTGVPRAPTAAVGTPGTQLATLDYVLQNAAALSFPTAVGSAGMSLGSDGVTIGYRHSAADAMAVLNYLGF